MIRSILPRVLLALSSLGIVACAVDSPPAADAAPPLSTVSPPAGDTRAADPTSVDAGADTRAAETGTSDTAPDLQMATVYRSCDQVVKDSFASLSDLELDALLAKLKDASCDGSLFCEAGGGLGCGDTPGDVYSTHSIGCTCYGGRFSCRDYRVEARGCAGLRGRDAGAD
jgi:hypothetical protein